MPALGGAPDGRMHQRRDQPLPHLAIVMAGLESVTLICLNHPNLIDFEPPLNNALKALSAFAVWPLENSRTFRLGRISKVHGGLNHQTLNHFIFKQGKIHLRELASEQENKEFH